MYQILQQEKADLLAVRVVGLLTEDDYQNMLPLVENRIAEHGEIDLFWEMDEGFVGWSAGGAWEDFKFDAKHRDAFGKVAIVGSTEWHDWMAKATDVLSPAEIKFFELKQREAALAWVRS